MEEVENLFDEEILAPNIKGAAYFILLYEHFEDVIISSVKEFYSDFCMLDGMAYSNIDGKYIKALEEKVNNNEENHPIPYKRLLFQAKQNREKYLKDVLHSKDENSKCEDGKTLRGSLKWLRYNGVFSDSEVANIFKIRKRRNEIVHELLSILGKGLTEEDALKITQLLEYNGRVNNWRFQTIDMPVMEIELPDGTAPEDLICGDDIALMGILRILFYGEGEAFKEELKKAKKKQKDIEEKNNEHSKCWNPI